MPETIDLDERFDYHKPDEERARMHEAVRQSLKASAYDVLGLCPPGRERSLVLTKLEEAMFWANAAIARS